MNSGQTVLTDPIYGSWDLIKFKVIDFGLFSYLVQAKNKR